jgi:hypothetical protein
LWPLWESVLSLVDKSGEEIHGDEENRGDH